jgi:hypothetical protein
VPYEDLAVTTRLFIGNPLIVNALRLAQ